MDKSNTEMKQNEPLEDENEDKSSSNVIDSNSERDEGNDSNLEENNEIDSGTLRKKNMEEIFKMEMRKNLANQMLLPPPEELFKRSVIENE